MDIEPDVASPKISVERGLLYSVDLSIHEGPQPLIFDLHFEFVQFRDFGPDATVVLALPRGYREGAFVELLLFLFLGKTQQLAEDFVLFWFELGPSVLAHFFESTRLRRYLFF